MTQDVRKAKSAGGSSSQSASSSSPRLSGGPGKRTLTESLGVQPEAPRTWPDAVATYNITPAVSQGMPPAAAAQPAGQASNQRPPPPGSAQSKPPAAAQPAGQAASKQRPSSDSAQNNPPAGPANAPGLSTDPQQLMAELLRIAGQAQAERALDKLRALSGRVEAIGSDIAIYDRPADAEIHRQLVDQLERTQNVLLGRFQALVVTRADETLQAWDAASEDDRRRQRVQWQQEGRFGGDPETGVVTEDWCGMFANAQFRAAGFANEFSAAFDGAETVSEFFLYHAWSRSPGTIVPHGKGEPLDLQTYHGQRGSVRTWRAGAAIGDDIRAGDVVTLQLDDDTAADHVCIVASYTPASGDQPGTLVTIDGNAYGARKPGAAAPAFDGADGSNTTYGDKTVTDVSTSSYQRTGDAAHPEFDRSGMIPAGKKIFRTMTVLGRGRPSVVDFERDHVYPDFTGNPKRGDPDGPGGPIQSTDPSAAASSGTP